MKLSAVPDHAADCIRSRPCLHPRPQPSSTLRHARRCRAAQNAETGSCWKAQLGAAAAASVLALSSVSPALANEFDLISEPTPTKNYILDDAQVLNKTNRRSLNNDLLSLENSTGYRLEVATVRKLETESDAFAFGDKLIEKWYGTVEKGSDKGILLIVTTNKDGALTGGPKFLKAVGDVLIDSVVSQNIPILTSEEKYNETVQSSVARIAAKLSGEKDPGPPIRAENKRERTYKTKQETAEKKSITGFIVAALLGIAFIVPMVQYWGYTRD